MIGKLKGVVDSLFEDKLILDVNGVGYNIYASSRTIGAMQEKKGKEVAILVETIVREDHIHLYGFVLEIEKTWFNELCKVSGVGSKVALKILGSLSINDIILALNSGDKALFSSVPGIGPKLALRIVSELKDSAKKIGSGDFVVSDSAANKAVKISDSQSKILADAISALENLGYRRSEIYPIATNQISQNPGITLESLITNSLRLISKK
ncbi:MAG: ruvA [Rickettsiaceae bacterium]|jgi:Holliday junction DNA helicase RuvA|nr:ruvA [Rickettsiaceae bacterium]